MSPCPQNGIKADIMAYGSMKTCYFTQWDVGKRSNCTWAHGESLCPQSHALTSAFKCHPKQQGRAFSFLSCLSIQRRHKPCYTEAEETKEHLSATLVFIVERVEVLSMMVRSDPGDTWHCTAEYNLWKDQVLLRRCILFSFFPFFLASAGVYPCMHLAIGRAVNHRAHTVSYSKVSNTPHTSLQCWR